MCILLHNLILFYIFWHICPFVKKAFPSGEGSTLHCCRRPDGWRATLEARWLREQGRCFQWSTWHLTFWQLHREHGFAKINMCETMSLRFSSRSEQSQKDGFLPNVNSLIKHLSVDVMLGQENPQSRSRSGETGNTRRWTLSLPSRRWGCPRRRARSISFSSFNRLSCQYALQFCLKGDFDFFFFCITVYV